MGESLLPGRRYPGRPTARWAQLPRPSPQAAQKIWPQSLLPFSDYPVSSEQT